MLLTMKEGEQRVTGFPVVEAFAGRIIRAQNSDAIITIAMMPLMIKILLGSTYSAKQPALEGPPFKRYACMNKGIHALLNTAPGSIMLANSKIAKT